MMNAIALVVCVAVALTFANNASAAEEFIGPAKKQQAVQAEKKRPVPQASVNVMMN